MSILNLKDVMVILDINRFFMFLTDFINEESLLSFALRDMNRENTKTEIALLNVIEKTHEDGKFAHDMTQMFT